MRAVPAHVANIAGDLVVAEVVEQLVALLVPLSGLVLEERAHQLDAPLRVEVELDFQDDRSQQAFFVDKEPQSFVVDHLALGGLSELREKYSVLLE